MKCRRPTDGSAPALLPPQARRTALIGLTTACVLAHAAVLGSLARPQAAAIGDAPRPAAVLLTQVVPAVPAAPPLEAASKAFGVRERMLPAAPTSRRPAAESSRPGVVGAAPESAPADPEPSAEAETGHLPTSALDVPPMPRSTPDEQYVEHVHRSGLPMQIRLYVDASGSVTETTLLGVAPGDEEAAEHVMAMFRDTAFSPGRRHGREVASFIDIELVLEPVLPPLGRIVRE